MRPRGIGLLVAAAALVACGGGGGSGSTTLATATPIDCGTQCAADALTLAEVERVVAQAVVAAQARGQQATVAVVDRVGNVLAVYAMTGAAATFTVTGGRGVTGGLEQVAVLPSSYAAISKALTGAYLSSAGNAFSSRTASQIVQENFNPLEANQPAGPLFGVQFSQLSCSDLMRRDVDADLGPKRSPLGLAADPGGLPLYKNGRVVGGIGVIADGVYGLDRNITDVDSDTDEVLALAGASGFSAPTGIRANRITADGRSLRYADAADTTVTAAPLAGLPGALQAVPGYFGGALRAGAAYGLAGSGMRRDTGVFADLGAYVMVDGADTNRYPVQAGTDGGLSAPEVQQMLRSALQVAARTRAQIRQPAGQAAQVTITVVDSNGAVLGLVRTPDAPVFGVDVALQKARSAAFLSHPLAGAELQVLPDAAYLAPSPASPIAPYVAAMRAFVADATALANGMAFSTRAIGALSRPFYPDGVSGTGPGP
ncbi:MAG: heme-binding protein, partial [Rhodoferax sp.]|nr:heme-binding protein [Rhodoferax sp.]